MNIEAFSPLELVATLLLLVILLYYFGLWRPYYLSINAYRILITGGASGIGLELARQCLAKGAKVIMWDINATGLQTARALLQQQFPGADVQTDAVNVGSSEDVLAAAERLRARRELPEVIISNAGVVAGADVHCLTDAQVRRTLDVNLVAHFNLMRAFLPTLREARRGRLAFISSIMGLVSSAGLSDYCASKAATLAMAASLRLELARDGLAAAIPVVVVCPNQVTTGMFSGIRGHTLRDLVFPPLTAEYVARRTLHALEDGVSDIVVLPVLVSWVNNVISWTPLWAHDWLVGWVSYTRTCCKALSLSFGCRCS
jgi:NAD(P)-dependent dehydrogenase (short-subunit alcohol dehydrogenase family)